tara:strand:+ start:6194 stop:6514 length:321 start_codon:yes stop_codon:yes gene_type:complete
MQNQEAKQHDRGGWLWVSAGILSALIVVQGAGLIDTSAQAEMSSESGAYTIMSTDGGNEELLFVVDSGQEALMVYKSDRNHGTQLLEREDLAALFARARARAFGTP